MPHGQPNYLNIDVNGRVSALFTGGLILPVPVDAGATTTTSITWTRAEDGGQVANLRVERTLAAPARNTMYQRIVSPNGVESAEIDFLAADAPFTAGAEKSSVKAFASAAAATILDSKSQSSFLQFGGAPKLAYMAYGASNLTWPGGSPFSNNLIQNAPGIGAWGAAWLTSITTPVVAYITSGGTNQFQFAGRMADGSSPVAGTTVGVCWVAFGTG